VLPGVQEASNRVDPEFRGKALAHYDVVYGLAYNTEALTADQVPGDFDAFTRPEWRGKLVINSAGGAPFTFLSLKNGKDSALDLAKGLVANGALIKSTSPAVVEAVATGEAPLGIGSISQVGTQKILGAPVEWKPPRQVAVNPLWLYVPKNAPHPNLARLFLAWLVTEGMPIQEQEEALGRVSDPTSTVARILKQAAGAEMIQPRSEADWEAMDTLLEPLQAIHTGQR
jgi:iron(III) transport system substrate-binding protein